MTAADHEAAVRAVLAELGRQLDDCSGEIGNLLGDDGGPFAHPAADDVAGHLTGLERTIGALVALGLPWETPS